MTFTNIREYNGEGLPDWIKEGGTVAVISGLGYQQSISFEDVTKVTATQVVVGTSRYNLKKNLRRMGDTGSWAPSVFLADPDSLEVRRSVRIAQVGTARYQVVRAAEDFGKNPTPENAALIVAAIARWERLNASLEGMS